MTKTFNISLPAEHHSAFDKAAELCSLSLSDWLGQCCLASLPPRIAAGLSERRVRRRPARSRQKSADTNPTHRVNLAAPPDHHLAFVQQAAAMGYDSLSEWMCACGQANLRQHLPERASRGRPRSE